MTTIAEPFAGTYVADPLHSSFQVQLRHMGVGTFRTGFEDVEARLEHHPDGLRLSGRALASSIAIRGPRAFRDHVVDGEDFFNARRFPEILFASTHLKLAPDGAVVLDGLLTMAGHERTVSATGTYVVPAEDLYGNLRGALSLTAEIDRRDWGMRFQARLPGGGDVLSWNVAISIHMELVAAP